MIKKYVAKANVSFPETVPPKVLKRHIKDIGEDFLTKLKELFDSLGVTANVTELAPFAECPIFIFFSADDETAEKIQNCASFFRMGEVEENWAEFKGT